MLFFIDGTDRRRLKDSWEIFETLKTHPDLQGIPIIVCATKQDKEGALSAADIERQFMIYSNNTPSIPYTSLSERLEATEHRDGVEDDDKRNLVLNLVNTDEASVKGVIDALFVRVQTSPRG